MWGPGKEMMKSYEKNRGQLNRRNRLKENLDSSRTVSKLIESKEVSKEELELIKIKFLKKRRRENKKTLVIFLFIVLFVIFLGYYFIFKTI